MTPTIAQHYRRAALDNLWRRAAGRPERPLPGRRPSLEALLRSEWSLEFERVCQNGLVVGALRYGLLDDATDHDRITAAEAALRRYRQTGDLDALRDLANMARVMWVLARRNGAELAGGDKDQGHMR